jgi:hypothetical protein
MLNDPYGNIDGSDEGFEIGDLREARGMSALNQKLQIEIANDEAVTLQFKRGASSCLHDDHLGLGSRTFSLHDVIIVTVGPSEQLLTCSWIF